MIEFNKEDVFLLFMLAVILSALTMMILSAGCVTAAKNVYKEAIATPIPTPSSPTPAPTAVPTVPTPVPTPKAIETLAPHYVDPFLHGERWEGQWFKWIRMDVQGYKDLEVGILAYRHAFLDYYTWWNAPVGNYMVQKPAEGNRYFAVWVHEEMFGNDSTYDPSMWVFDETSFRLQVKDRLIESDQNHNPVNRIREFDRMHDLYDAATAPPFAWDIRYSGNSPETAGMVATRHGWLRMGEGNSVDGYILFEVPEGTMEEDILLTGSFSRFGTAYWRFTK